MLGRRIDALERRLGIKLMHRTTRHLTLTERGTVFLDHCRKITDELEQTEQMIRERTGHFIVSASTAFSRKHAVPHTPVFPAANSDVKTSFNIRSLTSFGKAMTTTFE